MKLNKYIFCFLFACFLSLPLQSFADNTMVQTSASVSGGQPSSHWLDKISNKIGLTPDQKGKLKGFYEEFDGKMKALHTEEQTLMKKLEDLVSKKATDKELTEVMDALAKNKEKSDAATKDRETLLSKILSPTQHAQLMIARSKSKLETMENAIKNALAKIKGKLEGNQTQNGK